MEPTRQVRGLDFAILDSGCCGMAGSFGYEQGHYKVPQPRDERVLFSAVVPYRCREMKLRFGKADHGWLPATLELDDGTFAFDVSYLPYDFVGELVAALSGVLEGPGEYVARICEEPTEHDWRFRAFDRSAVVFEVVTYGRGRGDKGEVVAQVWGTPLEIVLPLWRGLRELSSRARAEGWRSHWSQPFPFDALDRLTERVETRP